MTKTTKKREKAIVTALTLACETAKSWDIGFLWLTHTVRHDNFPDSLLITCVFSLDAELVAVTEQGNDKKLRQIICEHLEKAGFKIKNSQHHVRLDSEESCLRDDAGSWKSRLERQRR